MANAISTYRDVALADRNADPSFAALLAHFEDAAPPRPLPPLAPARRLGSQPHLPPVSNLLKQPGDWTQSNQTPSGKEQRGDRKVRSQRDLWLIKGLFHRNKPRCT